MERNLKLYRLKWTSKFLGHDTCQLDTCMHSTGHAENIYVGLDQIRHLNQEIFDFQFLVRYTWQIYTWLHSTRRAEKSECNLSQIHRAVAEISRVENWTFCHGVHVAKFTRGQSVHM